MERMPSLGMKRPGCADSSIFFKDVHCSGAVRFGPGITVGSTERNLDGGVPLSRRAYGSMETGCHTPSPHP